MKLNQNKSQKKKSVILIDDSRMVLGFLLNYLHKEFDVKAYTSGLAALDDLKEGLVQTDCIITDFNMPGGLSGLEVIQKARDIDESIPVIVLSGSCKVNEKIDCLKSGAKDFIVKPFNPLELSARVDSVIQNNLVSLRHAV